MGEKNGLQNVFIFIILAFLIKTFPLNAAEKPAETNESIFLEEVVKKGGIIKPTGYINYFLRIVNNTSYDLKNVNLGLFYSYVSEGGKTKRTKNSFMFNSTDIQNGSSKDFSRLEMKKTYWIYSHGITGIYEIDFEINNSRYSISFSDQLGDIVNIIKVV